MEYSQLGSLGRWSWYLCHCVAFTASSSPPMRIHEHDQEQHASGTRLRFVCEDAHPRSWWYSMVACQHRDSRRTANCDPRALGSIGLFALWSLDALSPPSPSRLLISSTGCLFCAVPTVVVHQVCLALCIAVGARAAPGQKVELAGFSASRVVSLEITRLLPPRARACSRQRGTLCYSATVTRAYEDDWA